MDTWGAASGLNCQMSHVLRQNFVRFYNMGHIYGMESYEVLLVSAMLTFDDDVHL